MLITSQTDTGAINLQGVLDTVQTSAGQVLADREYQASCPVHAQCRVRFHELKSGVAVVARVVVTVAIV